MADMFGLLKELTTSRTPEKLLVREDAKHPITKHVNAISLVKTNDELDESVKEELTAWETKAEVLVEMPRSQPIGYYLKHEINEKLIEGLVDNHKYNDSLLATHLDKMDHETYNLLPARPIIGRLKYLNALIEQGSDVNVMPISIYNRLTSEKLVGTDIRLSLASHSYIYPLGIAEDVLIDIVGYVYPVDFVILYIEEDENKPFILETPFLTTTKAEIRFDKGITTLKSDEYWNGRKESNSIKRKKWDLTNGEVKCLTVIFDKEKPGSSLDFCVDNSWMMI
ncbi:zinc finger, CCHC-type containing protein [Tanacetum coccineum]